MEQNSILLFFTICILVRLSLVYFVKNSRSTNNIQRVLLILILASISIGFLYQHIKGDRKKGAFGQIAWWSNLRIVHSTLYAISVFLLIMKNKRAYIPLLLDVVIGLLSFINHHYL